MKETLFNLLRHILINLLNNTNFSKLIRIPLIQIPIKILLFVLDLLLQPINLPGGSHRKQNPKISNRLIPLQLLYLNLLIQKHQGHQIGLENPIDFPLLVENPLRLELQFPQA